MKLFYIFVIALIGIANAQFRFRNPFSGFRVPSFRAPSFSRPSRPRAPRVNGASFSSSSGSGTVSRPNALFTVQAPSIPASPSSASSAPVVSAPVVQTSSVGSSAIREIPAPDMTQVASAPEAPRSSASSSSSSSNSISSPVPSGATSDSGAFHTWQGRRYLLSWREGRNGFSHGAARSYCRGRGMRIVSLDNLQKAQHFLDLVERNNVPYFWAGGQISSDKRTLTWENGRREGISRGRFPWSTQGSRGRQPDGGFGSENCLAILNNVYNDRVKFHDVGCEHTKPTVCE